jgi:predicted extracellular nuclease
MRGRPTLLYAISNHFSSTPDDDVLVREDPAGAYSYVFEGQAPTLDQLFVSPRLRSELERVRMAHINADGPAALDRAGARGTSDHDPPVARFER